MSGGRWAIRARRWLPALLAMSAAPLVAPWVQARGPVLVLPPALDGAPRHPGPSPRRRSLDPVALNARCEGCHQDIAAEWRGSLHQRSHDDPSYQRQFAREPLPFCRGCHAPEGAADQPTPPALASLGVGCVTCHVVGDQVLAAPRPGRAAAPHPLTRTAEFAGPDACASCHEFFFPGLRPAPLLMQSTMSEHRASARSATSCASCHMPRVEGPRGPHRSHRFAASRDAALLRRSIAVRAVRSSPTAVTLHLRPLGVGHALPTGDLFRRLELHAEVVGDELQSLASATRYLTRHFQMQPSGGQTVKLLRSDDRLTESGASIEMELGPAAAGHAVSWRVAYQRVDQPDAVSDERAEVEGEIVLASGSVR